MAVAGQLESRCQAGVTGLSRVSSQWATALQQPGLPGACFLSQARFLLGDLFGLTDQYSLL